MPIYLLTPLTNDAAKIDAIDAAVVDAIPGADRLQLQANRGWLYKFDGTTIEASNAVKLTDLPEGVSPPGPALVVPVVNYYGRGPSNMWEWLKIKLEQ
jgi:hypothetical protein